MPRTSDALVRAALETDSDIKVAPYITTANALTNYVVSKDVGDLLTAELTRQIETYLAAHFYALRDEAARRASASTDSASASFQGKTEMYLDATLWGQQAKMMDVTGTLTKLDEEAKASRDNIGMVWLGTRKGRGDRRYL